MKLLPAALRRPRTFWVSIVNLIGLACSLAGVWLLFRYALPNQVPDNPGGFFGGPKWAAEIRSYDLYSDIGLALVVVGTFLEAAAPLCTAFGSWRRRPPKITSPASPQTSTGLGAAEPGVMLPRLGMNIDVFNKWLSAGASVAVIVGVVAAGIGAFVAVQSLKETQEAASATLMLSLRDKLEGDRYGSITAEIQNNDAAHALRKGRGGKFNDIDVEEYMSNFEDIAYLIKENVIDAEMAYDHFSYDVEKAWCYDDVHAVVQGVRKADKSNTATSDPFYGNFEKLALSYLARENQKCKDINNQ